MKSWVASLFLFLCMLLLAACGPDGVSATTPIPTYYTPTPPSTEPYYVCTDGRRARVRSCPSLDCEIVTLIPNGERVQVFGSVRRSGGTWYKVQLADGRQGYVFSNLLCSRPPSLPEPRCICSYNAYDCPDFPTQAAAQACYEYCLRKVGYDVHWLDDDGDGVACEWNP